MKTKQLSIFACFACIALLVSSCTIHPFAYTNPKTGGEVASLGASLLTKSKSENAFMKKGDMVMGYNIEGKSEVSVPNTWIWASALSSAIDSIGNTVKALDANATTQAVQSIKSTEAVELSKVAAKAAAVEPAAAVVP